MRFKVPLIVTNHNALASERITIESATTTGVPGSVELSGETSIIEPGKRMDLALDASATSPGAGVIRIVATLQGGRWRKPQTREVTMNIEVWPQRAKTPFHATPECRRGACLVAAEYTFGKVSGPQACFASVSVNDDTTFATVRDYGGDCTRRTS